MSCLSCQRGSSLLEVLIAVLVLAIGVLGAASLQLNALRFNASAAHSTLASFIAYDILDRMRANYQQLDQYVTQISGDCQRVPAFAQDILARDLADLHEAVSCLLPGGTATVERQGARVIVTIAWSETRIVAGQTDTRFVVSSEIGL
ncbi:type IV pilus modification protein PilV [Halopseudomonas phragmitis]|uniref:Type IV pilus modification protein PilV n=2 Tax=Pseudomonadaceae TaxID=135621 RepID=A0A1V0B0Q2_9GAMM|nr:MULTISPECIES: type IV pilus modification protein PilV [Pseudomonadaceae]AQZ93527.1 type IV pilus modification protein PilV [Halopseudomonas phragmitis]RHW19781.1 type IV pilus modification protein PilV [Pseudomonas jilinensis]